MAQLSDDFRQAIAAALALEDGCPVDLIEALAEQIADAAEAAVCAEVFPDVPAPGQVWSCRNRAQQIRLLRIVERPSDPGYSERPVGRRRRWVNVDSSLLTDEGTREMWIGEEELIDGWARVL